MIKKGEFQVGDNVIFAEIDTVLPEREEYEFLRTRKFRISTVRLRGQISQGICFPLSFLPEGTYEVGEDITDLIGAKQYDPPLAPCLDGVAKGVYPGFLRKSDETRIQVLQSSLTEHKGVECSYSEKLEGTSSTYYLYNDNFGVCSKTLELLEHERNAYWQMARKYQLEEKLRKLGRSIALQGEIIGDSIQGNYYKLKNERRFYLFNIFDIERSEYLQHNDFIALAKELDIETVPILEESYELSDNIDDLVELSIGNSLINPELRREGIVAKIKNNPHGANQISFKSINPEYLLKSKI